LNRIGLIFVTALLLASCTKKEQMLSDYDFNSGQYKLYAIQEEGEPTEFVRQHPNFKITDLTTLNKFKEEWKLEQFENTWACGLNYSFYLMKNDSCVNKFGVNMECGFLNTGKGSYLFDEELISKYKSSIIDLPKDSAKIFENKILKRN
jgi:hypothetical protein